MHKCRICGWTGEAKVLNVREMQFDTREEFRYFECENCHCLQIEEIPEDLGSYYGAGYYSYRSIDIQEALPDAECDETRVLDIGCGAGEFLCELARMGFTNLTGCDPFIENDIVYENGVHIHKCGVHEMEGQYDWICMNDSLEHVTDPHEVFDSVKHLLAPRGIVRIKVPVYPNVAFDMFGTDWFQLDAPRHIFLHSQKSMELLAKAHGLVIIKREYDSAVDQIIRSYLYSIDISLWKQTRKVIYQYFTEDDLKDIGESCKLANENEYGDHAVFYLTHAIK